MTRSAALEARWSRQPRSARAVDGRLVGSPASARRGASDAQGPEQRVRQCARPVRSAAASVDEIWPSRSRLVDVVPPEVRSEAGQIVGAPRGQHAESARLAAGRPALDSNWRTQERSMRSSAMRARTPSGTVPRSSPTTTAPARCASRATTAWSSSARYDDVRAMAGVEALGDPVEALQSHDVIDAQVGGVTERPPQHADEVAVAVVSDPLGVERRKRPILPAGEEEVGWRAPVCPRHERIGRPERVEPIGMDADGEVGVERDRRRGGGQLLRRHPLGVEVVRRGWVRRRVGGSPWSA